MVEIASVPDKPTYFTPTNHNPNHLLQYSFYSLNATLTYIVLVKWKEERMNETQGKGTQKRDKVKQAKQVISGVDQIEQKSNKSVEWLSTHQPSRVSGNAAR